MKIKLIRKYRKPTYTIGKLYVDDVYVCDTLEDTDRDLDSSMSLEEIKKKKVYGQTAIPTGTYNVTFRYSPKFKNTMAAVNGVKGYEGVLIHWGNTDKDTLGCILCGKNTVVGKVTQSRDTIAKLYRMIRNGLKEGPVSLTITH